MNEKRDVTEVMLLGVRNDNEVYTNILPLEDFTIMFKDNKAILNINFPLKFVYKLKNDSDVILHITNDPTIKSALTRVHLGCNSIIIRMNKVRVNKKEKNRIIVKCNKDNYRRKNSFSSRGSYNENEYISFY